MYFAGFCNSKLILCDPSLSNILHFWFFFSRGHSHMACGLHFVREMLNHCNIISMISSNTFCRTYLLRHWKLKKKYYFAIYKTNCLFCSKVQLICKVSTFAVYSYIRTLDTRRTDNVSLGECGTHGILNNFIFFSCRIDGLALLAKNYLSVSRGPHT